MNIMLICSAGMSTSMMVAKMRKVAKPGEVIEAYPYTALEEHIADFDVVLLGPQIRFRLEETKRICEEYGKKAEVIDMRTYGTMDGASVYTMAEKLMEEK